jgi:hypothetical protein
MGINASTALRLLHFATGWDKWERSYDLVLIFPFLGLFSSVKSNHRLSLIIYVAVLLYSGLLSIYYLFLHKQTRGRQARSQADEAAFTG